MAPTNPQPLNESWRDITQEETERLPAVKASITPHFTLKTLPLHTKKRQERASDNDATAPTFRQHPYKNQVDTALIDEMSKNAASAVETMTLPVTPRPFSIEETSPTIPLPSPSTRRTQWQKIGISILLCIIFLHAMNLGAFQFIGPQGWAYVLGGPADTANANLLKDINSKLHATPGDVSTAKTRISPQQYVSLIVHNMTLDQKLGQMMLIQFTGATYSLALSTMISQYHVGSVLIFTVNGNVVNRTQLKGLVQQMQHDSGPIPLGIAIDQEGGYVDRLVNLDGPRPAEATLGAADSVAKASAAGMQDAKDLSSYGININLAPVVDVDNAPGSELDVDMRTYGSNPAVVTKMAGAYLQGLQRSGKVIGTLKHFPGLGDVNVDPHKGIPHLLRSKAELEQIDWAPYRALIQRGEVDSIMVTHEIVDAIDSTKPASLSPQMIQGILRHDLGFKGVIMTDSLTMAGITDTYTPGQAAALSIEAGADMIMGAASPDDVGAMISGIKQEMASGNISQQRIDDSVSRILMMKYQMGLITIPKN